MMPTIVILLTASALLAALIVFPLLYIIRCANDGERTPRSKGIWMTLMVLLWPLPGLIYGLAHEKNLWLRGLIAFSILLPVGMLFLAAASGNKALEGMPMQFEDMPPAQELTS